MQLIFCSWKILNSNLFEYIIDLLVNILGTETGTQKLLCSAIRYIQAFLGHNSLKTCMRYIQVSRMKLKTIQSPLDKLNL